MGKRLKRKAHPKETEKVGKKTKKNQKKKKN